MIRLVTNDTQLSSMNILLNDKDIIDFYSTHNVKTTLKKFNIKYSYLKDLCTRLGFTKTSEQLKETYKNTREAKYGSIEGYREAKRNALNKTLFGKEIDFYNEKEKWNE